MVVVVRRVVVVVGRVVVVVRLVVVVVGRVVVVVLRVVVVGGRYSCEGVVLRVVVVVGTRWGSSNELSGLGYEYPQVPSGFGLGQGGFG